MTSRRGSVPLTVRLRPDEERTLDALARRKRMSRSDVVREAVARYGESEDAGTDTGAYHAWLDVVGIVNLAVRDPDRTTGEQLTDVLRKGSRARHTR